MAAELAAGDAYTYQIFGSMWIRYSAYGTIPPATLPEELMAHVGPLKYDEEGYGSYLDLPSEDHVEYVVRTMLGGEKDPDEVD
jgi:hypothetical protein